MPATKPTHGLCEKCGTRHWTNQKCAVDLGTCEWCRDRKAKSAFKVGKRPGVKLPLLINVCDPCRDRLVAERDKESDKK